MCCWNHENWRMCSSKICVFNELLDELYLLRTIINGGLFDLKQHCQPHLIIQYECLKTEEVIWRIFYAYYVLFMY